MAEIKVERIGGWPTELDIDHIVGVKCQVGVIVEFNQKPLAALRVKIVWKLYDAVGCIVIRGIDNRELEHNPCT